MGKIIKTSKRKYVWSFRLHDNAAHPGCKAFEVVLTDSQVSKKRQVHVNGVERPVDSQKQGQNFADSPVIVMTQPLTAYLLREKQGHQYDLYIEGQRFQELAQLA